MSDRAEAERREMLRRLRDERPPGTWFICGYTGDGPPGYDRVYPFNRVRYVDVPQDRIRDRHAIPGDGPARQTGVALIVDGDAKFQARRTKPADLLEGSILTGLWRIATVAICYTSRSKTPRHKPGSPWLDAAELDVDWRPGP